MSGWCRTLCRPMPIACRRRTRRGTLGRTRTPRRGGEREARGAWWDEWCGVGCERGHGGGQLGRRVEMPRYSKGGSGRGQGSGGCSREDLDAEEAGGAVAQLSDDLVIREPGQEVGHPCRRLKLGVAPRINRRSLDHDSCQRCESDPHGRRAGQGDEGGRKSPKQKKVVTRCRPAPA